MRKLSLRLPKDQRGSVMITALLVSTVAMIGFAIYATYVVMELNSANLSLAMARREELVKRLRATIEDPAALLNSMNAAGNENLKRCLEANDTDACQGVDTDVDHFFDLAGFNLYERSDTGLTNAIAGTPLNPVYYDVHGRRCTSPNETVCIFQATAEYRPSCPSSSCTPLPPPPPPVTISPAFNDLDYRVRGVAFVVRLSIVPGARFQLIKPEKLDAFYLSPLKLTLADATMNGTPNPAIPHNGLGSVLMFFQNSTSASSINVIDSRGPNKEISLTANDRYNAVKIYGSLGIIKDTTGYGGDLRTIGSIELRGPVFATGEPRAVVANLITGDATNSGNLNAGNISITGSINTKTATYANTYVVTSDLRKKSNVRYINETHESVMKLAMLRGRTYKWRNTHAPDIGFIAQEVEEQLPVLVKTGPDGLKSVNYLGVLPVVTAGLRSVAAVENKQQQMLDQKLNTLYRELTKKTAVQSKHVNGGEL